MDMIPRSYREGLRARRTLLAYGGALALLLVVGVAGAGWLRWRVAVEAPRLEQMRAATAQAAALQASLTSAEQRKSALLQAGAALGALRNAGAVGRLAAALDGALNERVWFDQMQFTRSQDQLRDPLPNPLPEGTLQIQGAAAAGAPLEHWNLGSHIAISGQALDHDAVTRFLAALGSDPSLTNVRFLNSAAAEGGALSFSVSASLRANGGAK
jgi:Tfp pilus assembly protein PilN